MFGDILKKTRLVSGLSQEEMAEETHLSRSTVSRLENNKMEIKAVDLISWLQATNAPEIAAAIICGVDLIAVSQLITSLVGGFINFLI